VNAYDFRIDKCIETLVSRIERRKATTNELTRMSFARKLLLRSEFFKNFDEHTQDSFRNMTSVLLSDPEITQENGINEFLSFAVHDWFFSSAPQLQNKVLRQKLKTVFSLILQTVRNYSKERNPKWPP
jgi:hypothetical protein